MIFFLSFENCARALFYTFNFPIFWRVALVLTGAAFFFFSTVFLGEAAAAAAAGFLTTISLCNVFSFWSDFSCIALTLPLIWRQNKKCYRNMEENELQQLLFTFFRLVLTSFGFFLFLALATANGLFLAAFGLFAAAPLAPPFFLPIVSSKREMQKYSLVIL